MKRRLANGLQFFAKLMRTLKLVWKGHRSLAMAGLLLTMVEGILPLVVLYVLDRKSVV